MLEKYNLNPTWKKPITVADEIYVKLMHEIVEGIIPSGSKINEIDIANRFNVSRAPLREAINRLENCHIIYRKPNVGARVITLSLEHLNEIFQLREVLESYACSLAAKNMEKSEIDEIKSLLSLHLSKQRVREGESYYQEEGALDFHYRVIKGSKNQHLISILCGELYYLIRMYRVQLGMVGPRVSKAFDEHMRIIEAIDQGDGELASLLMKRHIQGSKKSIESKLNVKGV